MISSAGVGLEASCDTVRETEGGWTESWRQVLETSPGHRVLETFLTRRRSEQPISCHCLAFFRMVPTAEMTVVLVPLAVVVTETTAGRVAVVVMSVGWARVTGMAESHLLFLFWASAGGREVDQDQDWTQSWARGSETRWLSYCYIYTQASYRPLVIKAKQRQ